MRIKEIGNLLVLISVCLLIFTSGCVPVEQGPVVTSVWPDIAVVGDEVKISGNHMSASQLSLGGQPVEMVSNTEHEIRFTVPELATGAHTIEISNQVGTTRVALKFGTAMSSVVSVAAGSVHSCAVQASGSVLCWGSGGAGQLGNGSTRDSTAPLQVRSISDAATVSNGNLHSCAVLKSGSVACWGFNLYGQLGFPPTSAISWRTTPNVVAGISNAVRVDTGAYSSCAVTNDGQVLCWGEAAPTGMTGDSIIPSATRVDGITNAVAVGIGDIHRCVLLSSGDVRCWGLNTYGQLGAGAPYSSATPRMVAGISNAVDLAVGGLQSCVVLSGGTVQCWGGNINGNPGVTNAVAVSVGASHACALLADGTVSCWGSNNEGQLGNSVLVSSTTAIPVAGLANVASLSASSFGNCVALQNGQVHCWGDVVEQRVVASSTSPVTIGALVNAASLSAKQAESCALSKTGGVSCWGRIGNDEQISTTPEVKIGVAGAVKIATGQPDCVTSSDGSVQCWDLVDQTPKTINGLADVVTVGSGDSQACALLKSGQVSCWQTDKYGAPAGAPVLVNGINNATDLGVGSFHACVATADGLARCWGGDNDYGQLGDGTAIASKTPVQVANLEQVKAITAGGTHSCAMLANGQVWCWGNGYRLPANGDTLPGSVPVRISDIDTAVAIDASTTSHTCALLADGSVKCWGIGADYAPVVIAGIDDAVSISVGAYVSCATLKNGEAQCWGSNEFGQLTLPVHSSLSQPIISE